MEGNAASTNCARVITENRFAVAGLSDSHTCRKLGSWSRGDQVFWSHLLDPGAIRVDSGAIRVDSGAIRGDPGAKRGSYRAIKNKLEVKVILNGII